MILIFKVNEDLPYTLAPHPPHPILCWNYRKMILAMLQKGQTMHGAHCTSPPEGSVHFADTVVHPKMWS